jgi:hypothetical protein
MLVRHDQIRVLFLPSKRLCLVVMSTLQSRQVEHRNRGEIEWTLRELKVVGKLLHVPFYAKLKFINL